MHTDSELLQRLTALADRLPSPLVAFAESLARQRDRSGEEDFRLTPSQREQANAILASLALGHTGKDIPSQVPASERVSQLAEHVRLLRERKKAIEEELSAATDELVREAGVGVTATTGEFRIRVGEPRLSVRVQDATLLPSAFLSLQPDRKAILAHIRAVAEVPPGAELSETRPTVTITATQA